MEKMDQLTLDSVYKAKYVYVLKDVIRPTNVIPAPKLRPGTDLYLKTENLQVTGAFKIRGAYYKISQLSEEERQKGVVACSAGNHAQGVALAAQRYGIKAVICLPDGAPDLPAGRSPHLQGGGHQELWSGDLSGGGRL